MLLWRRPSEPFSNPYKDAFLVLGEIRMVEHVLVVILNTLSIYYIVCHGKKLVS